MSFIKRLKRKLVALRAPEDTHARELYYLKRAYDKTQATIDYWKSQWSGVCCPYCQFPFLNKLVDQQAHRLKHIEELEKLCQPSPTSPQ
jgi:hypothetical protein